MIKAFLISILIFSPLYCFADSIKFQLENVDQDAQGFYLYQRLEGQPYDYNSPVVPKGFKNAEIPIDTKEIELENLKVTTGMQKTYFWVLRVFNQSAISLDSNEVSYTVFIPGNLKIKIEN